MIIQTKGGILLDNVLQLLRGLPWSNILLKAWNLVKSLFQDAPVRGIYEVLEYESTLELKDIYGKRASFQKRQRVRYLQDYIIAYQDQAWGDGEILRRYRCAPGIPVDRYRIGHKTHILISLREVKQRGGQDEFNISWEIQNGFRNKEEEWETELSHPTRQLKINLLFPASRPPRRVVLIEGDANRSRLLDTSALRQLADRRWQVSWETSQPMLHERYILKWAW